MNKLLCLVMVCLVLCVMSGLSGASMGQNQTLSCPSGTYLTSDLRCIPMQQHLPNETTTKTYQNFGLGFSMQYPGNLALQQNPNNITLKSPLQSAKEIGYVLQANVAVYPWAKYMGLQGMFTPPNLDTAARQLALVLSNGNFTITNKTRVTVDNTTAYLIHGETVPKTAHGGTIHLSTYVMLKGDVVYMVSFLSGLDQQKWLPIEQKMIQSFRFL